MYVFFRKGLLGLVLRYTVSRFYLFSILKWLKPKYLGCPSCPSHECDGKGYRFE